MMTIFTVSLQAQAQAMHQAALHAASHGYAGGYASGYVGGFAKPPFAPTFPVQPVYPVVPVASGLGDRHGGNAGATASLANGQGHQTAYLSDRNDPSKVRCIYVIYYTVCSVLL